MPIFNIEKNNEIFKNIIIIKHIYNNDFSFKEIDKTIRIFIDKNNYFIHLNGFNYYYINKTIFVNYNNIDEKERIISQIYQLSNKWLAVIYEEQKERPFLKINNFESEKNFFKIRINPNFDLNQLENFHNSQIKYNTKNKIFLFLFFESTEELLNIIFWIKKNKRTKIKLYYCNEYKQYIIPVIKKYFVIN